MTTFVKPRITSIDFLRGFIMIIMALDHVRDYLLADSFLYDPLDLEKTSAALFFTRWITHFCAPVFMLLAGTSAFLISQKKTKKQLSVFLVKRGLWLIFLEMIVVNFGWNFNIMFPMFLFITIWALGISMIVLAVLIYLPKKLILVFCIALIAGHNLFDGFHVAGNTLPAFGWAILHDQQFFTWHKEIFLVGYPIIPWIGVMPLGYLMGQWYANGYNADKRKKNLLVTGCAAIVLFIIVRALNIYGDPSKWSHQNSPLYTLLSFIKVTKYPPSLLYLLITAGPALVFLALTEKMNGAIVKIVSIYGRVPMFYYLIHIYVIHLIAMIASGFTINENWRIWILSQPIWFTRDLKGYGFSLPVAYLIWVAVIIALYPLCKRYDVYKQAHKEKWWLSYM
jgi:uncharacterized membrane protein